MFTRRYIVLKVIPEKYPLYGLGLLTRSVLYLVLNRKMAIDLITNYASTSRKFQYMFLTPLSLEHLKDRKEDVEVVYFEKNQG